MAMAAKVTIVQVAEVVEPGKLDPESIVTPGIFVERVVTIANPAHESELVAAGASYPQRRPAALAPKRPQLMREILLYETDFGDKPVEEFLTELAPSPRAKI